jgi:microcystin-dependent protein
VAQGYQVPIAQRVWDADGEIASGWKFTTYEPGTTTPLTTYSDTALSAANTNPVLTNASGFFVTNVGAPGGIYVAAGVDIKLSVTDENDVPQANYSVDNLLPMVDPTIPDPSVTAVPPGGLIPYGGTSAPTGYLLCDGSLVSRATYATLFAIVSTAFGAGDGMTTFGLPDLRGRFPLGQATSGTGSTLGGTGGLIDHIHTGPSHTHSVTVTRDSWGATLNTPSTTGRLNTGEATGTGEFSSSYQPTADLTVTSAAGGTGNTGTANPPFQAVNYLIKT